MDLLLAIAAGVGLAAACGFRVFLPLLATALAVKAGYLHPSHGMEWLASPAAVPLFGTASVVEVAAYYIPWLGHLLDVIASPAAVGAGTLAAAASLGNVDPAVRWSLAIIAGGGAAAAVQAGTVTTRAASGMGTAGAGNKLVATLELVSAAVLSAMAIIVPILALVAVAIVLLVIAVLILKLRRKRRAARDVAVGAPRPT